MLHPYQNSEFWANHPNESLRYVKDICVKPNQWVNQEFKFKIVKSKTKRGYDIMLLKILFDGNNYMNTFEPVSIGYSRNRIKANNFIKWFNSMNDKNKDKYLSQFNLQERMPKLKQGVVINELIQNNKGQIRKVSTVYPKGRLRNIEGEPLDFDGVDRVKELIDNNHYILKDTHLNNSSILRTNSNKSVNTKFSLGIKRVHIDTDRTLTKTT